MDEHKNMRPLAMDEDAYLRRELTSEEPVDETLISPISPEAIEAICATITRFTQAMTSATDAFRKAMAEGEKVQTNADWIRSLSDEELCHVITNAGCASDFLDDYFPDTACTGECSACMLRWLREEHKEAET